ncbi:MAG: ABC transporter ATP-binding protein [Gordonia sp. (in: high G+C Gram-positive bacteria)]
MTNISIHSIAKEYDGTRVLDNVSFDVGSGEILALLGASGSGKSTTLRLIAGLEELTEGQISFGDQLVSAPGFRIPANRRNLGYVFQNYALWPHLSVLNNVAYPLRARGLRRRDAKRKAGEALELVKLTGLADRRIGQLSGGQQQRIGLARAVVAEPSVILFDEPLSNLDTQLRFELRREIKRLHEILGFTAVYVTHDYTEALSLSDRIAVFRSGRIEQIDTAEGLFDQPANEFVGRFFGFDNFIPAVVTGEEDAGHVRISLAGATTTDTADGSSSAAAVSAVLPTATPVQIGSEVTVATRSSNVAALPIGESAAPTVRARVLDLDFAGANYIAHVQLGDVVVRASLPRSVWGGHAAERIREYNSVVDVRFDWQPARLILAPSQTTGRRGNLTPADLIEAGTQ